MLTSRSSRVVDTRVPSVDDIDAFLSVWEDLIDFGDLDGAMSTCNDSSSPVKRESTSISKIPAPPLDARPRFASSRARQQYEMTALRRELQVLTETLNDLKASQRALWPQSVASSPRRAAHVEEFWRLVAASEHDRLHDARVDNKRLRQRVLHQRKLIKRTKQMILLRDAKCAVRCVLSPSGCCAIEVSDAVGALDACLTTVRSSQSLARKLQLLESCPDLTVGLRMEDGAVFHMLLAKLDAIDIGAESHIGKLLLAAPRPPLATESTRKWNFRYELSEFVGAEVITSSEVPFRRSEVECAMQAYAFRHSGERESVITTQVDG